MEENMTKINIDGVQNCEVSIKIPCEKSLLEQLEIMEAYTKAYQESPIQIRQEEKSIV